MKANKFFDDEIETEKHKHKKEKVKIRQFEEPMTSVDADQLSEKKVNNKNIFGFMTVKNNKNIFIKWDKENEFYVEYILEINSTKILFYSHKSLREYNAEKAMNYIDEIMED